MGITASSVSQGILSLLGFVSCNNKAMASTYLDSGIKISTSPSLNLISASTFSSKALPRKVFREVGKYKNWWVTHCFPSLNFRDLKNGQVSRVPVAPMTFMLLLLKFPSGVFKTEYVAPVLTKNSVSSSPSFALTRGSAGRGCSGPHQSSPPAYFKGFSQHSHKYTWFLFPLTSLFLNPFLFLTTVAKHTTSSINFPGHSGTCLEKYVYWCTYPRFPQ